MTERIHMSLGALETLALNNEHHHCHYHHHHRHHHHHLFFFLFFIVYNCVRSIQKVGNRQNWLCGMCKLGQCECCADEGICGGCSCGCCCSCSNSCGLCRSALFTCLSYSHLITLVRTLFLFVHTLLVATSIFGLIWANVYFNDFDRTFTGSFIGGHLATLSAGKTNDFERQNHLLIIHCIL